jgi:hypothetical protein
VYAVERLKGATSMLSSEGGFTSEGAESLKAFPVWLETFRGTSYHVFVFSLSEEPSLLSQWRSYTSHGKGVSLGFQAQALNDIVTRAGCRLGKCLYDKRDQADMLILLLKNVWETFQARVPYLDTSQLHPSQKYFGFLKKVLPGSPWVIKRGPSNS